MPDDGGADVFAHVRDFASPIGGIKRGDPVSYVVTTDERSGKHRARNITRLPKEQFTGTVTAYSVGRGFGFIAPDSSFLDDVYVRESNLQESGIGSPTSTKCASTCKCRSNCPPASKRALRLNCNCRNIRTKPSRLPKPRTSSAINPNARTLLVEFPSIKGVPFGCRSGVPFQRRLTRRGRSACRLDNGDSSDPSPMAVTSRKSRLIRRPAGSRW